MNRLNLYGLIWILIGYFSNSIALLCLHFHNLKLISAILKWTWQYLKKNLHYMNLNWIFLKWSCSIWNCFRSPWKWSGKGVVGQLSLQQLTRKSPLPEPRPQFQARNCCCVRRSSLSLAKDEWYVASTIRLSNFEIGNSRYSQNGSITESVKLDGLCFF